MLERRPQRTRREGALPVAAQLGALLADGQAAGDAVDTVAAQRVAQLGVGHRVSVARVRAAHLGGACQHQPAVVARLVEPNVPRPSVDNGRWPAIRVLVAPRLCIGAAGQPRLEHLLEPVKLPDEAAGVVEPIARGASGEAAVE